MDNYHKHNIVFSAYSAPSSSQTITTGNVVYFDQTMVKSPETKFDLSTGTFTASVNGIYEFSYTGGCLDSAKITRIAVKQNRQSKLTFEHYGSSSGGYGLMNFNWILKLQHKDTVQLYITDGKVYSSDEEARVFNGKLIQAL